VLGTTAYPWHPARVSAPVLTPPVTSPRDEPVPVRERRTPAIVTRLVTIGLVIVAAGVVVSAMGQSNRVDQNARPAAQTDPALVVTGNQPTEVRIRNVSRAGDAILLRVDPIGSAGARTLVLAPGAHLTLRNGPVPLQQLLDGTAGRNSVLMLEYDAIGQVVALTQR
jgi:hypothetical protein